MSESYKVILTKEVCGDNIVTNNEIKFYSLDEINSIINKKTVLDNVDKTIEMKIDFVDEQLDIILNMMKELKVYNDEGFLNQINNGDISKILKKNMVVQEYIELETDTDENLFSDDEIN